MAFFIRSVIYSLVLLIPSIVHGEDLPPDQQVPTEAISKKKTVCLNMIVKNESEVIIRSLTSVLPLIDYWVIVDTGSTDKTQDIIRDFMKSKGIPGELHERPWVNFAYNRNEALELAKNKAEYTLFMDADDYLQFDASFKLPVLDKDMYYIMIHHVETKYKYGRIHLVNNHLNWIWKGVLHEGLFPATDEKRSAVV